MPIIKTIIIGGLAQPVHRFRPVTGRSLSRVQEGSKGTVEVGVELALSICHVLCTPAVSKTATSEYS